MNSSQQSNKLAKNVSAVIFTRPAALLATRISTTNWRRYPSTLQYRSFMNKKMCKAVNNVNQQYSKHTLYGTKQWKSSNSSNYSFQMKLALRGYYN
mmetsp:Transcript_23758/g.20791  ORF Transcript_23758/g.20791 Transcript_23758/m.20791 type:complete len:96 (+) Transcript_23758:57-344(+)